MAEKVKKRTRDTWLALILVGVAVPIVVIGGILALDRLTSAPLHTSAADVTSAVRSTPLPKWTDAVERSRQLVRAAVVEQNLPAVSVAVGIGEDTVWAEAFGWANLKDRVPASPDMKFRIGHASKALTSAAVGVLLESHRLDLDQEIQTYVPAFPRKQWPVTLRQLMAHVAGIHHYRDTEWGDQPAGHCERASEGLQSFANDPLLFQPGTQYRYSTYGWVLVSAAVEAAANEPFFAFMRDKVFAPLDMTETEPDSAESKADRVTPYHRGNFLLEPATGEFSCFAGAGGLLSTPSDLVRFGIGMRTAKLLQPATVKMLQTPQVLVTGKETAYGLGWMLETVPLAGEPTQTAGHGARTIRGGSATLMTFPARSIVVAVTTNKTFADTKSVALRIADAFAVR